MGDEFDCGGSLYYSDGGEWRSLGSMSPDGIRLSTDSIGASEPLDLHDFEPVPMHLKLEVPWWRLCGLRRLLGFKPAYTIRRLRRGGKSHRGKGMR